MIKIEETELKIVEKGEYKNIYLNEKEEIDAAGTIIKLPKLREERYVIVEKLFDVPMNIESTKFPNADGTPKTSYLYKVKYLEEEVSFFLNKKKEADALNVLGGIGSNIKITAVLFDNKFGGKSQNLSFELVE